MGTSYEQSQIYYCCLSLLCITICCLKKTKNNVCCVFTSPSTLLRSFWRCCFQFCGTFTRHWDEMTSQALPPKTTNRVYVQGRSDSHHFAWAGLDLLSNLPVLMCGRFQLCVEAPCSPIYFCKPRWTGCCGGGGGHLGVYVVVSTKNLSAE